MLIERSRSFADQVEILLRGKIASGEYLPGSRLPSESELAAQLGVSRGTVRTALSALEAERLILRRQGDGTYVNKRVMEISAHLGDEWDFQYMIQTSGRTCRIEPLRVELRQATGEEEQNLEVENGEQVLAMQRLFFADEQPIILSTNVIPARFMIKPGPYRVDQPIRQILRQYSSQEIVYSISDISATHPSTEVVSSLQIAADKPLLKFLDIFYNNRNYPVVIGVNFYNDKALRLRVSRIW